LNHSWVKNALHLLATSCQVSQRRLYPREHFYSPRHLSIP
jgi:hypothetical protein